MTKIAILDDYHNVSLKLADWESLHGSPEITVFTDYIGDEDRVAERLAGFDVVAIMRERTPFPASLIRRLPDLRLLVTTGARNASVDLEAAAAAGVTVCGTGGSAASTAELAWGLILAVTRHIPAEHDSMKTGGWQTRLGRGLGDQTLGIVGLGRLGSQVAAVGKAFGMNMVAWSQNMTDAQAEAAGARRVDKAELFETADIITIHLVLSERSRGLVGADEFAAMKPTASLINTSRGPIVDEAALVDALSSDRIAGVGLDVFDIEPLPADHALRGLDNVVLTPHIGYVTEDVYRIFYTQTVEDIAAFLAGAPIRVITP
jgi:phosphoglycerate dehydrogenase-like enzyme